MSFAQIINQDFAKQQLISNLTTKHFPSYLLVGPKGVGKRTLALVLAKSLVCEKKPFDSCDECSRCKAINLISYPEVRIIFPIAANTSEEVITGSQKEFSFGRIRPESPSNGSISIDRIRELKYEMGFQPIAGKRRVIIIIDADKMTNEAANSFLKTLEEPQGQTSFILTTQRSSALLPTIRSRCQTIRLFSIPKEAIADFLIGNYQTSPEMAKIAADVSEGSIRRALEYINEPEQFLAENVKDLFEKKEITKLNLIETSSKLNELSLQALVNSLLFIHRQAGLAKLGFKTYFSKKCLELIDPQAKLNIDQVMAKVEYLLFTLNDTEFYLNKRLFLHSILVRCLKDS